MGKRIDISNLRNDYQFFNALGVGDHKIGGNCNLLAAVEFHGLGWGSPISPGDWALGYYSVGFRQFLIFPNFLGF